LRDLLIPFAGIGILGEQVFEFSEIRCFLSGVLAIMVVGPFDRRSPHLEVQHGQKQVLHVVVNEVIAFCRWQTLALRYEALKIKVGEFCAGHVNCPLCFRDCSDEAPNAADQQQDRRQACLPTGLAAAFAGCEARSAEQPADDHPQHCRGRARPRQCGVEPSPEGGSVRTPCSPRAKRGEGVRYGSTPHSPRAERGGNVEISRAGLASAEVRVGCFLYNWGRASKLISLFLFHVIKPHSIGAIWLPYGFLMTVPE